MNRISCLTFMLQVILVHSNLMKSFKSVTTHDIFYPLVSFHRVKSLDKLRNKRSEHDPLYSVHEKMNVKFHALGKDFDFNLELNERLLAPHFQVETLNNEGRVKQRHHVDNCFYNGKINNRNDTLVSLSNCNGLSGIIQNGREHYYIRPAKHDEHKKREDVLLKRRAHVIRRTREWVDKEQVTSSLQRYARFLPDKTESECGLDDVKPHVRWVRNAKSSKEGEQVIETMLAIDHKMAQYYGMDASKQYALTIANAAHHILRDSTIGPNTVNLIITKLIVLTSPLNDLSINHHARNSLSSFGRWAEGRNNLNDNHPDHYDYSVLLTKHDICVDSNQPCETKGLSYVGGMCAGSKSAAIIEDDGFGAAFTLAHQTGHSLGMDHDNVGNSCVDSKRIMSSYGAKTADAFHWSPCSVDYLQQFLRTDQSKCLEDQPPRSKRESMKTYDNPGRLSGALLQCQMIFGADSQACFPYSTEQICSQLTCTHPVYKNCSGVGIPSIDGTFCGDKKWCKQGACVYRDNQRNDNMVDGGWSNWSSYQPCSRSCGGGITFRERLCENPKPKNGGEYCEGDSRSYSLCNKQLCPNSPSNYRRIQCQKLSPSYYGDKLLNWTFGEQEQEFGCDLHCHPTSKHIVKKYFGHVADGTDCFISNINGKCIQGECNVVGCDMTLGSTEKYDRCGLCKSDGSTCDVTLKFNPLLQAERKNNGELVKRIEILETETNATQAKVASRLMKLRAMLHHFAQRKCNGKKLCVQDMEKNISQKTIVPNIPARFYWHVKSQGCSVSCGRGFERFQSICVRSDDESVVGNRYCDIGVKPNDFVRTCLRSPCSPGWSTSKWSACSKSCGGGRKTRSIYCAITDGVTEYSLQQTQCDSSNRPPTIASCNLEECPIEWYAEPYGQCTTTCGVGTRVRAVRCRHVNKLGAETVFPDSKCAHLTMPVSSMLCNVHKPCPGDDGCGSVWNDLSGVITSPGYPSNYKDNLECVHEIQAPKDKVIMLNFTDVQIDAVTTQFRSEQCAGDFLRITEGKCSNPLPRPSILVCGNRVPGLYTSRDSFLCLKFVSDQSGNSKGFSLIYNISKKEDYKVEVRDICDVNNMVVNSTVGVLTSPNYPRYYPPNEECKITLNALDNTGFMIKFDAFQVGIRSGVMKCKTDFLQFIYDGKSEEICGSEAAIPTIHIPAPQLTIKFHSSSLKLQRKGFVLTYVTKQYARIYAKTKHAIQKIDDYSTTLNEWKNRQVSLAQPNNELAHIPTVSRVASVRKNTIGRSPTAAMINNRKQLVEVLLKLADVNPENMKNILTRQKHVDFTQTLTANGPNTTYASLRQYVSPVNARIMKSPHTSRHSDTSLNSALTQKKRQTATNFSRNNTLEHLGNIKPNNRGGPANVQYVGTGDTHAGYFDDLLFKLTEGLVVKFKQDILKMSENSNTAKTTTRSNVPPKPVVQHQLTRQSKPTGPYHSTGQYQLTGQYQPLSKGKQGLQEKVILPVNDKRENSSLSIAKNTSYNTTQKILENINPNLNSTMNKTVFLETNEGSGIRIHKTDIPHPATYQAYPATYQTDPATHQTLAFYPRAYLIQRNSLQNKLLSYSYQGLDNGQNIQTLITNRAFIPAVAQNFITSHYNSLPTWSPSNNQYRPFVSLPTTQMYYSQSSLNNLIPKPPLWSLSLPGYDGVQPYNTQNLIMAPQTTGFKECSRTNPVRCAEAMFRSECNKQNFCVSANDVCCLTDCFPLRFVCIPNG